MKNAVPMAQESTQRRWKRLVAGSDSKALWKAVNWNGTISQTPVTEMPSDDAFREHFEKLLNPPNAPMTIMPQNLMNDAPKVPVTDEPILPQASLNQSKSETNYTVNF